MESPWNNWINPIALQIGPVSIHWYGLMYLAAFVFAYLFLKYSRAGKALPLENNQKDNLLISAILGIILGGRLGYILFYNLPFYLENPAKMLALWEGGLSFHGGLIGTVVALWLYLHFHNRRRAAKQELLRLLQIGDVAVLIAPIGIMLGRLGNFINAELYGRISENGQFCLNFPSDPVYCRYPSQLFEAAGEGALLFAILYALSRATKILAKPGQLSAAFLMLYGLIRTLIEYSREPDAQIGYLTGGPGFLAGLSLGQLLSLLTALFGALLLAWLNRPALKSKAHHSK
jgi:phosphatidylglycerol:prolipoprotein diacylglycerol transferase